MMMGRSRFVLQYVSEELRRDKEFVLEAVRRNPKVLEYASEALRDDKRFVLEAVRQNPEALKYAGSRILVDIERFIKE